MPGVRSELILTSSGAEVRTALVVITKAVKGAIEEVMFKKSGRHVPIRFLASHLMAQRAALVSRFLIFSVNPPFPLYDGLLVASFSREDL